MTFSQTAFQGGRVLRALEVHRSMSERDTSRSFSRHKIDIVVEHCVHEWRRRLRNESDTAIVPLGSAD